jgi:uncharacterized membrane protein YgdD (TMEM256/DUF423 family)
MAKLWMVWGCVFGFLFVALGAFAAHGLEKILTPEKLSTLATANQYLGFHAFALLALGLWNFQHAQGSTKWTGVFFIFGTLVFSGSLYLYVLASLKFAAMITPLGGTLFLLGWGCFLFNVFKKEV